MLYYVLRFIYVLVISKIVVTNHAQRGLPDRVVVGRPIPSPRMYVYIKSVFTCTVHTNVYIYYTRVYYVYTYIRPGATTENKLQSMYEL